MPEYITLSLFIIGAYLLGSIPTAVWVGKIFFKMDVRDRGSGNAGATNVLRTFGTAAAIPVFLIDGAKGYGAVMLSWFTPLAPVGDADPSEWFMVLRIGLMVAAILGHIFPVFASFRGGKGVATIAGALIAVAPIPLCGSFAMFVLFWSLTSYLSLGSIMSGVTFPLWMFLYYIIIGEEVSLAMMIFSVVVGGVLVNTHKANIARLRAGTESKTYLFRK